MATSNLKLLCGVLSRMRIDNVIIRSNANYKPKYRPPYWYMPKERVLSEDLLTQENRQFLEEVMQDRLSAQADIESPLAQVNVEKSGQWTPQTRRVGVIARKIGNYPLCSKEGKKNAYHIITGCR
ncbi:39S ribosomal protein L3, mitochondrial-like [Hyposmocoma kahamanoa]|uniref:39S ribosomal protein L3, mitochondrial-like n=1 Tax=Hyposmocoma kahamanoa TaxID=1477025 RepID=UPI000E6D7539|nr:39S ribosomal protein L3, mitochondrial-like [Hyposmocoma kahamanoa]